MPAKSITASELRQYLDRLPGDMEVVLVVDEVMGMPLCLPLTQMEVVTAIRADSSPSTYDLSMRLMIGESYQADKVVSLRS